MGPARDETDAEAGPVLSPDEIDIENSDNVVPLDDGRYVIGSSGSPTVSEEPAGLPPERDGEGSAGPESETSSIDAGDVRRWLEDDLADVESRYGFHIAAKSGGGVNHQQMFSDDLGTVFDGLLM